MTVYVDDMRASFGRMKMCHMWADTRDELFAMADRIGVQRKWFQRPASLGMPGMDASWEHFDIALSKRALAVLAGASETDKYGPLEHTARLSGNSVTLRRIAVLRAKRHQVGDMRIIDAGPSEECGCPEERWIIRNVEVLIHIEADGSGDIHIDAGDWQQEINVACRDLDDLRAQAVTLVRGLPEEGAV